MVITTKEFMEAPTATLEYYGAGLRMLNALEEKLNITYIKQLVSMTREDLMGMEGISSKETVRLQKALVRFNDKCLERASKC